MTQEVVVVVAALLLYNDAGRGRLTPFALRWSGEIIEHAESEDADQQTGERISRRTGQPPGDGRTDR